MAVLLNQAGQAEDLSQQQADAALSAGTHSLPLVSPEGDPVSVSAAERDQHLAQGYKLPTSDQLQSLLDVARYGTAGQALGAGVEGALETASLGTAGGVEAKLGEVLGAPQLSAEAQRKRAEQNPVAHPIGEVVGAVAPTLLGDEAGALNVLGKAGKLGEAGAKALTGSESLAARVAGWVVRGAAESGTLTAEHVLNESILGDPQATAEHALAEVGVSTLLGGTGGAILGKLGESAGSLSKKILSKDGSLLGNLSKLKDNAADITEAASRLGVEPLPGQLSASKTVQDLQSQVAKEPTIVGRKEQAAVDRQFEAIRQATTDALGNASPLTKAEAGAKLQEGLKAKLEETYKPISDTYDYLKQQLTEVPLDDGALVKATRAVRAIDGVRVSPSSPEYKLAESVAEEVRQLSNVSELRQYASSVARRTAADPSLRYVGGAIRGILSDVEEQSTSDAVRQMVAAGRMSSDEAALLENAREASKGQYKQLMGQMGELGDVLGKRKVYGPQDFLQHLSDLPPEKLVDRLFQKNDTKFLKFLQANFPQQAETVAQYQKGQLAEKAFKDGMLQPGALLREADKLTPEVQQFLFSKEDLAKLRDAKTLIEAMPRDVNPSGTAKSLTWSDALNPARHAGAAVAGGLAGGPVGALVGLAAGTVGPEVSTWLKKSLLTGLVSATGEEAARHEALAKISDLTTRTSKNVAAAAKAVVARETSERLTLSKTERDAVSKKLSDAADQPQKLLDRVAKATAGMTEHAPNTSTEFSAAAGRAVQFLQSKVPQPARPSPFSEPVDPSDFQKATFKRYAESVLDPVGVMSRVHDGTVSTQDVEALQAVYPKLYESMRDELTGALADAVTSKQDVPYVTRLGVSLFLGTPVDRSLDPTAVASVQMAYAADAATKQPQQASAGKTGRSTKALAKVGAQAQTATQAAEARRSQA